MTLKALSMGAFDFVAKPNDVSARMPEIAQELISKIKAAAQSRSSFGMTSLSRSRWRRLNPKPALRCRDRRLHRRTAALQYLLPQLPKDFPGTILMVQHMPEGFTEMFSRRLDEICSIKVKEAQSGDLLLAGRALVCPGSRHLKVKRMPLGDVVVL